MSTAILEHTLTGESVDLETDFVVAHAGAVSNDELVAKLPADEDLLVRTIGDCISPRRLTHANWDADRTVLELMGEDSRRHPTAKAL